MRQNANLADGRAVRSERLGRLGCGRRLFAQASQCLLAGPVIFSGLANDDLLQSQTSPQDNNGEGDRQQAFFRNSKKPGDRKESHPDL